MWKEAKVKEILTSKHADLERPYEKCLMYGAASLSDAELLAVIIKTGTRGQSAIQLAEKILSLSPEEKGLLGICRLAIPELLTVPGIGEPVDLAIAPLDLVHLQWDRRDPNKSSNTGISPVDPKGRS